MSKLSKYADSAEQPEPIPAESRIPCDSGGVDVVLKGWVAGLNKVRLTRTFRAGGIGLGEASKLIGRILDGMEVRVRLGQFANLNAARAELMKIGVADVRG